MPKFRKKPITIEAQKITRQIVIKTLEGDMVGEMGDFLITGVEGEQYPCRADIFAKTYERICERCDNVTRLDEPRCGSC